MPLRSTYFTGFKGGPTLLIWGDAAGMGALSRLLREAAVHGGDDTFKLKTIADPIDGKIVNIRKSSSSLGLRPSGSGFEWVLDAETLTRFADLVDPLEGSIGHQYLDASPGVAATVMVSRGEYPDDPRGWPGHTRP
jgi:hypothetical protein